MQKVIELLKGKKTYVMCAAYAAWGIFSGVDTYGTLDPEAVTQVMEGIIGATFRAALAK